jgi:hypothetical protein
VISLKRIEAQLAVTEKQTGRPRASAEGELLGHPVMRRYVGCQERRLVVDRAKT